MVRCLRVKYVRAAHPMGRLLITAAFNGWGEELPDWRENEYARGQLELLTEVVRVIKDDDEYLEMEDLLDRMAQLVNSVQGSMLDETLADLGLS